MGRVPRITGPFVETIDDHLVVTGLTSRLAVMATVRQIVEAPELPMPGDAEEPLPLKLAKRIEQAEGRRLLSAFARRVKGERLWVWYRPRRAHQVDLLAVTSVPP